MNIPAYFFPYKREENLDEEPIPSKKKVPPSITREISATCTDQGGEGTCTYHSLAKVIVQNVFGVLIDLRMTSEETTKYRQCLAENPLQTDLPFVDYTIENCTEKGVLKIMLFHYVYEYLKNNSVRADIPIFDIIINMKTYTPIQPLFEKASFDILIKTTDYELTWRQISISVLAESFYDVIHHLLPLFEFGLYIKMSLFGHGVTLIGFEKNHFLIKNSWNETLDVVPYDFFVTLKGDPKLYEIRYLDLLLPMKHDFSFAHKTAPIYYDAIMDTLYPFLKTYIEAYPSFFQITSVGGKIKSNTMKTIKTIKTKKFKSCKHNATYIGLHQWFKSDYEKLGWMVLAKSKGMHEKVRAYVHSVQRLHDHLECKIRDTMDKDRLDDLTIMLNDVKVLLHHCKRDF